MDQFASEVDAGGEGLQWIPSISPGMPAIEAAQQHDAGRPGRALDGPGWPDAYARLRAELDASAAAPDQIRSSFPDRQLVDEIDVVPGGSTVSTGGEGGSWLTRLGFTSRNALEAAEALARTRPRVVAHFEGDRLVGQVAPPMTPTALAGAEASVGGLRQRDDGNPDNVYGDRFYEPIGQAYVNENRADAFFDAAARRLADYAPSAQQASERVSLTIDGRPAALGSGGGFSVVAAGGEAVAVVTDGAGRHSRFVFSRPASRPSLLPADRSAGPPARPGRGRHDRADLPARGGGLHGGAHALVGRPAPRAHALPGPRRRHRARPRQADAGRTRAAAPAGPRAGARPRERRRSVRAACRRQAPGNPGLAARRAEVLAERSAVA